MEFICSTINELDDIAAQLIKSNANARVFAFYGEMGAGKTTFIQHICKHLQTLDQVISPTFGIINQYVTANNNVICHFDFYRIKNSNEYFNLGCEEYFFSGDWCFIEWPEKIAGLLPESHVEVHIDVKDYKRYISF